jgi:hypothetical protein
MMNSRLTLIAVLASAALAATATNVSADGWGCAGPGCGAGCSPGFNTHPLGTPRYYSFGNYACGQCSNKPTFQAAPWYLYWPYDGHFLTPAPVTGAFYGPPTPGNFPVNPYFPGPAYGFGYGPMPGGPPPR